MLKLTLAVAGGKWDLRPTSVLVVGANPCTLGTFRLPFIELSVWALSIERSAFASAVQMPGRGLEPLRISPPDPKSGASANFATLASLIYRHL